ncbi:FliM/FliN family flagellar motor C-terminal domain-containing protein, partial [Roseivivax isoporae]
SDAGPPPHEDLVLSLPARIDAVLCRLRLPYATLEALAPGALLPLPPGALDMAELVAGGRHVVTRGRLGQMNGLRAIRVSEATGAARAAAQRAAAALAGPSDADAPADEGPAFAGLGDLDVGIPWVGDADPVPDPADDAAEGEAFELPPLDFDLALDGDGGQSFDFALDLPGAASSGDD